MESLDLRRLPILTAKQLLERQGINPKLADWRSLFAMADDFFDQMVLAPFYRYAECVQLAPASESDHHAGPGGLLTHTYDVITLALQIRRGRQLPLGGTIEIVNAQRYLWTYAVFAGALLHDVGKLMASIRIIPTILDGKRQKEIFWTPQDVPLQQLKAATYRIEFVALPYRYHSQIALTNFDLLPSGGRSWLSREPSIMMQLCAFLHGDRYESGAVGEIIESADMQSTARAQKQPVNVRFSNKPSTIERIVHWVRHWLAEGEIKLNRNGAMGWIDNDGYLYVVCRSLADRIIRHCDDNGITDIPRDHIRLYDIFQDYGFALPNHEGRAIWNVVITGPDYQHPFTCLKFQARRFSLPTKPLPVFDGQIQIHDGAAAKRPQSLASVAQEAVQQPHNQTVDPVLSGGTVTQVSESAAHEDAPVLDAAEGSYESAAQEAHAKKTATRVAAEEQDDFWPDDEPVAQSHSVPTQDAEVVDENGAAAHDQDTETLQEPVAEVGGGETPAAETAEADHETDSPETEWVFRDTVDSSTEPETAASSDQAAAPHHAPVITETAALARHQESAKADPDTAAVAEHPETAAADQEAAAGVPSHSKKFSRYVISGVPAYEPGFVSMSNPDIARMFVNWLRRNIVGKTITVNSTGALVHILEDGIGLLAPAIFKAFLELHQIENPDEAHKKLADKFARLKINIKSKTANIHTMYAVGRYKASKIHLWKIPFSVIFSDGDPIPEANRYVKSTPDM
jgi:hypothetical protein